MSAGLPGRPAAALPTRRHIHARLLLAAATATGLLACSREPAPRAAQFVGRWRSSRLATPLELDTNGEWAIRQSDGSVLQYGVWEVSGRNLVWTLRLNGQLQRDVNAIVSIAPDRFSLREQDGSLTTFERLR